MLTPKDFDVAFHDATQYGNVPYGTRENLRMLMMIGQTLTEIRAELGRLAAHMTERV